jgi:hypothetical protein
VTTPVLPNSAPIASSEATITGTSHQWRLGSDSLLTDLACLGIYADPFTVRPIPSCPLEAEITLASDPSWFLVALTVRRQQ